MSWKATAYVKDLQQAPSGQKITCSEKLIMFVLADCYNEDYHQAWPSVQRLATAALMTARHARRILRILEGKGLIQVVRRHGSGKTNTYRFPDYSPEVTKGKPDKMSVLSSSKSGQADHRPRTTEHRKSDTAMSGKPRKTETEAMNTDQEGKEFYIRELTDLKREGPIGETTRKLYRTRLDDPIESASLPEWFRREAEHLLRDYEESVPCGNSARGRQSK